MGVDNAVWHGNRSQHHPVPARRSAVWRSRSLLLVPILWIVLLADLAEPGWGHFANPVFYGRWLVSTVRDGLNHQQVTAMIAPDDVRLRVCRGPDSATPVMPPATMTREVMTPDGLPALPRQDTWSTPSAQALPVPITARQAALRQQLTGKSAVFTVQQLGSPACQLIDGSFRWLLQNGLSLDVQFTPRGTVDHADLTSP